MKKFYKTKHKVKKRNNNKYYAIKEKKTINKNKKDTYITIIVKYKIKILIYIIIILFILIIIFFFLYYICKNIQNEFKKTIYVQYVDFWSKFKLKKSDIHNILKEKYKVVILDKPDYIFFSKFG